MIKCKQIKLWFISCCKCQHNKEADNCLPFSENIIAKKKKKKTLVDRMLLWQTLSMNYVFEVEVCHLDLIHQVIKRLLVTPSLRAIDRCFIIKLCCRLHKTTSVQRLCKLKGKLISQTARHAHLIALKELSVSCVHELTSSFISRWLYVPKLWHVLDKITKQN